MTVDLFTTQFADNSRLAKSKTVLTPAAETYNLVRIPKFAFVSDVVFWVQTAGSSDTVSIGFVGNGETANPTYFLTTADASATIAGFKRAKYAFGPGDFVSFDGKYFQTGTGMITMTVGTTQTTGVFYVFVDYNVVH